MKQTSIARSGAFSLVVLAGLSVFLLGLWHGAADAQEPEEIRVSLFRDSHPLSGLNLAGEPSGLIPDLWRLWSEKTGVRVRFLMDDFADSIDAVREGRADVHGSLFWNEERAKWLDFSRTLQEVTTGIYHWSRDDSTTLDSLRGRSVGVVAGTFQERYLKHSALGFRVRGFRDVMDMLRTLARGEIAAVVQEDLSMDTLVRRAGVRGDVRRLPVELLRNGLRAGVPKNNPGLRDLVDWGFGRITYAEYQAVEARWVPEDSDRFFKAQGNLIPFNEVEKKWLANNPTIRVGMMNSWPPMSYLGGDGKPVGISHSIVELMNKRLGGILHIVPGPWQKIYNDVKEKRLDAILDITDLRPRQSEFNFTRPYLVIPHVIVTAGTAPSMKTLADLTGKTLAVERGFFTAEYVRAANPAVNILEFGDTAEALSAVAAGKADAYAGNEAVSKYLIASQPGALSGLEVQGQLAGRQSVLSVGTRKDWPILRDILDKAFRGIPPKHIARITDPWLGGPGHKRIELSPAEQRWLSRNLDNTIRVGIDDWPPFSYMKNGKAAGIAIEFARYALKELGLNVEEVPVSWTEAVAGISGGDKIDLIPDMARSAKREKLVVFTRDYLSFPRVLFTQSEAALFTSLVDLNGKTVAVERNFIAQELLSRDHPGIKLHVVETTHDALKAVSLGKADAYVGNLAAGTYHIERHGLSNLKVAAPTEYDNDKQAMAVRKDWPELASMIDKVLLAMTDEEHAAIRSSALMIKFEHGVDMKKVLSIGLPAGAVLIVIIAIFVYSNRRLAGEVVERKKAEILLKERESWFRSLLESAPDATVIVDPKGIIVRVNRQAEILFGADRERLLDQHIEILVPDSVRPRHVAYRDGFVAASAPRSMGVNSKLMARKMDGTEIPVEISLSPIETAEGTLIAASVRDVTDRRIQEAELAEKDLQLTASLENMSGGMFMVDKDLIIRVFNRKFADLYKLPEIKVGTPLRDILLFRAIRGEYGKGDPEELVEERLSGYRDGSIARTEDVVLGGTIVEGYRQPTADGGLVCVFNDITVRKKAEQALSDQRRKLEELSQKLSRYLSPQIYEAIFAGASDAQVRTERKKLTVFFSDIKNFTATTEEMEPEDMTYLLNDYLTKMTEIALEHGGTIDKYIGDAIMVFFGDPETKGVKKDALAAVRMAIAMQRRMVDLRAKWADMGFKFPFHIRCGVNTGYCNVGNFGSDQRIDYTIIGGQVNLAARLESICAPDGVTLSHETYSLVRDEVEAEPLEPIQVKGIKDPVQPFAVQGIFDDWKADERYIRRDDILGLRLWVDLMRMDDERRDASVKELEEAISILKAKQVDAADD
jgi:PAS domain S-box-containing protein